MRQASHYFSTFRLRNARIKRNVAQGYDLLILTNEIVTFLESKSTSVLLLLILKIKKKKKKRKQEVFPEKINLTRTINKMKYFKNAESN